MRQEDTVFLAATQEQSYARAGEGLLESYPKSLSMSTDELAAFLSKKRYAVLATTTPNVGTGIGQHRRQNRAAKIPALTVPYTK
jgi:hypothetical protein